MVVYFAVPEYFWLQPLKPKKNVEKCEISRQNVFYNITFYLANLDE